MKKYTLGEDKATNLMDGARFAIVTADGKRSAHYEHTVAIGPNGPEVLTSD